MMYTYNVTAGDLTWRLKVIIIIVSQSVMLLTKFVWSQLEHTAGIIRKMKEMILSGPISGRIFWNL